MTAPPTTAPVDRPGPEPSVHARRWWTLVFAGLLFTYGVLGDRYGRRLALVVGLTAA